MALFVSLVFATSSNANGDWAIAHDCFNSGDFDCAYDNAVELFNAGRIFDGNDERTMDSMMFFQMAFVEKIARSSPEETFEMTDYVVLNLGKMPNRLPFVFGFALLASRDVCVQIDDKECSASFDLLYCKAKQEMPPPSWRPLNGTDRLSATGESFFGRIMQTEPVCSGA
jgi:hypothetical protein